MKGRTIRALIVSRLIALIPVCSGYSRLDVSLLRYSGRFESHLEQIYLNLTVSGRANYGDVIAATFSFIKLMKKHGAKAFERQFREYQT